MDQNTIAKTATAAADAFTKMLGRLPRWVVTSPGRVNLIGEHTDYNDGYVLPMAIDRHVAVAADLLPKGPSDRPPVARVYSTLMDQWAEISLQSPAKLDRGAWSNYVAGTLAGCSAAGLPCPAFVAVIHADLPLGGGLSSSAALEVAVATLAEAMTGQTLDPVQKALLCQKAEHEYADMPCGIMDQFSSIFGRAGNLILLDCRSQRIEMVSMTDPTVRVLIVNSNVKHNLADGEYAKRRAQCAEAAKLLGVNSLRDATPEMIEQYRDALGDVRYRRARHVIGENDRTLEMARAVRANDWDRAGELMYQSHASLRDDFEVSCAELDLLVEIARRIGPDGGVHGSRMTGGGFGGCTVSLIRADAVPSLVREIGTSYVKRVGIEPSVFVTKPSDGPIIVKQPTVSPVACDRLAVITTRK